MALVSLPTGMKPAEGIANGGRRAVIKCGTQEWSEYVRTQYKQALALRRGRFQQEQIHQPIWWEYYDLDERNSQPVSGLDLSALPLPAPLTTGGGGEEMTSDDERSSPVAAAPQAGVHVSRRSPTPAAGLEGDHFPPGQVTKGSAELKNQPHRHSRKRHAQGKRTQSAPVRSSSFGQEQVRGQMEDEEEDRGVSGDVLFYPFGQASEKMLTHNVRAPHDQVYPAALRALHLRRAEARQRLESSRERLERQARELLELSCSQRDRNIWKTEYQRQYG